PGAGGVLGDGGGAVRLLHSRLRRLDGRPARAEPGTVRRRDPRGALRQPLPLHRVPEDPGRRASRRRAMSLTRTHVRRGRATPATGRQDAVPKVTGEFAYSSDLHAAGMLWGRTVRSPHAHARVLGIDVSTALGMPGVRAVLTHEDVPGQKT